MTSILQQLHLSAINEGGCIGGGKWLASGGQSFTSHDPTTEEVLGEVKLINQQDYEAIIKAAEAASLQWRQVPAPKRGELVRLMGEALRAKKRCFRIVSRIRNGEIQSRRRWRSARDDRHR